ncbi:FkbM family methyltransferase [Bradyrhizobium manausense]|uniref:FkbM family methyltransferase n=1 Tax=Bradyrhizobium manausense TaxID=989370 RepID=UPI001BADC935|nr:FkbM family methyltransferase [Bradyrhizobium manausense]MBR0689352.1 FkbM family methyltransferase [Bradyrhizobium manausense]MBR0832907.1 FkbM family methyltransferase [Bradyrhizobium manausense]
MREAWATQCENAHFVLRCLRYRFRTERLQLQTISRLNLHGATVLDIGANKGIYSFWLARAAGPDGLVLAFEPQPEMVEYIGRRRVQFGWRNVNIMPVALSDIHGSAQLSRQRIGDGSASLSRSNGETISVPTMRLDELPDVAGVKFIKCDVEGHELKVFAGGERTIRTSRPVIQFEATPPEDRQLFEFFESLGYLGVMLLGRSYLPPTNPDRVPHYKFGLGGHRDFLFFPPEAIGTIIPEALARAFPAPCSR